MTGDTLPEPATSSPPPLSPPPHVYCVCAVQLLNGVQLFVAPWTGARQAPLSMEFSRQEYWNGLPFPTPEDLPVHT